jgi:CheY-like chemotaxis protein
MMNLLSNAMKFTLGGGTVHVALETDKEWAHLRIADSGQGFGRAFLEAMFQPFSQEEEATTRSHGGLGLGLMIVKRLVEAHGGRVSAESAGKGMGATFFVDLPRGDSEIQADAETKPQARAAAEGRAILQGLRTLIVEDHADSRQLLHTILQHYGAHVFDAASAGEGLALLKSENVDVIVSDVGMPEVDGYEFLRFLRRGEMAARNVPVIALSAYAGLEDRQRALAAGFQAYATKPINPRELVDIIAGAAGRTDG